MRTFPIKYSAGTYKEYIHTKYDYLLTRINKLPNAEVDDAFYKGLKACVQNGSDLPYFQDFASPRLCFCYLFIINQLAVFESSKTYSEQQNANNFEKFRPLTALFVAL